MVKIAYSIYKLDTERIDEIALTSGVSEKLSSPEKVISILQNERKNGLTHAAEYKEIEHSYNAQGFAVKVFDSNTPHPHSWNQAFELAENLQTNFHNLVAFFYNKNECYAITAGHSYSLLSGFIDTEFPFEVARRIMSPEINETQRREISGALYGQLHQFRSAQSIASTQNLSTIFVDLKGKIDEPIRISHEFMEIFDSPSKAVSISIGAAITIQRKIESKKIPELIRWLKSKHTASLTPKQESDFSFLDGMRKISRTDKALRLRLDMLLSSSIKKNLDDLNDLDLDFSHNDFLAYSQATERFIVNKSLKISSEVELDSLPRAEDILGMMLDREIIDTQSTAEELLDTLKVTRMISKVPPRPDLNDSVFNHMHGEIQVGKNVYFKVDGYWYMASKKFLERLSEDFSKEMRGRHFTDRASIGLVSYSHSAHNNGKKFSEANYNDHYLKAGATWLVADKVLIDNVEIADLIHISGNNVNIIHNKHKFGASMRDVCSQVRTSMEMMKSATQETMGNYYDAIAGNSRYKSIPIPLTKEVFVEKMLTGDITYTIGYIDDNKASLISKSTIAKLETINIIENARNSKFKLLIAHIDKMV